MSCDARTVNTVSKSIKCTYFDSQFRRFCIRVGDDMFGQVGLKLQEEGGWQADASEAEHP